MALAEAWGGGGGLSFQMQPPAQQSTRLSGEMTRQFVAIEQKCQRRGRVLKSEWRRSPERMTDRDLCLQKESSNLVFSSELKVDSVDRRREF